MTDEKKEETKKEEEKPLNMVDGAFKAAAELKVQNAEMRKNIEELQKLKAIDTLGGQTDSVQPDKPKDITDKEYKDLVMAGKIPPK